MSFPLRTRGHTGQYREQAAGVEVTRVRLRSPSASGEATWEITGCPPFSQGRVRGVLITYWI